MGQKLESLDIKVGEVPNKANDLKPAKAITLNFKGGKIRWTWLAKWEIVRELFLEAYEAEKFNEGECISQFLETVKIIVLSEIYRLLQPPSRDHCLALFHELEREIEKGQELEQFRLSIPLVFDLEKLQNFLKDG